MTIKNSIPGPTLQFDESGYAMMYAKNNVDVEASINWHDLFLPNFYDGVSYLTTI